MSYNSRERLVEIFRECYSVAIDLLTGIIKKGVVNPAREALHLPRTVSDLDDSTIIMFIDEFQNSRMPQYDFSVTGFHEALIFRAFLWELNIFELSKAKLQQQKRVSH